MLGSQLQTFKDFKTELDAKAIRTELMEELGRRTGESSNSHSDMSKNSRLSAFSGLKKSMLLARKRNSGNLTALPSPKGPHADGQFAKGLVALDSLDEVKSESGGKCNSPIVR